MKNVLLCIDSLENAGAQRFVTELACNFTNSKYKLVVVVTTKFSEKCPYYIKLVKNNINVINVSGKNIFEEIVKIRKVLKETKPDIIHSNVSAVLHMLLPLLVSRCNARHLFTVHSMGYRIFTGAKKRLIKICFKKGWIIPVAICDTVKKSIIDAYDLNDSQVECVYNGVDTQIFSRLHTKEDDIVTFISVGTLYHIKNHKLLIDAFSILHKKYNNTELRLVGDGVLRQALEEQVWELGVSNSVVFEGNQSDVASYLNQADVYCCTSEVEGLPISVLEAMACELPVITTPAGGVVDIVADGVNGFVVDYEPEKIAERMEILVNNAVLRRKMGSQSREMVTSLDIRECAKKYEILYDRYSRQ